MTQQQTDNKAAQLLIAAVLTQAMAPTITGLKHDDAEALIVTQHERWYNFCARAMLPNGTTMPDGTTAHPAGVYDDPPAVDPAVQVAGIANAIGKLDPSTFQGLIGKIAPLLALIPGAGPAVAAAASTIAALPPIGMPTPAK